MNGSLLAAKEYLFLRKWAAIESIHGTVINVPGEGEKTGC